MSAVPDGLDRNVIRIRLRQLNSSQNSIQTMSMWIAHHHNEAGSIADAWLEELCTNKANSDWCKAMFYLANDVVQNCRKEKKHVCEEFYPFFLAAVEKLGRRQIDRWEKVIGSVYRVIDILKERNVYTPEQIKELKSVINWRPADGAQTPSSTNSGVSPVKPARKEEKPELSIEQKRVIRKKIFEDVETSLKSLISPASTDSAVRQKIAGYSETIADTRKTAEPKTLQEAREIYDKANEALPLVRNYAQRVKAELTGTREAQKRMDALAEFMKSEVERDKDILELARSCLDGLHKKKAKIEAARSLLSDSKNTSSSVALPEIENDL
ncbi:unnamed protein product [Bursaphelenchus xylophilus]|uniref:(pine wood nematode) hypothetical protein n=1 Tax=Bursaphelenchus xylophilus TaxID=6326 RepID=A0A1I7SQW4_BURXY|nr:unnamed protein product [Bursaphelenchus xylophilus]CAG9110481.1 unnamed protein product [Bursaphelenchus xylophilus]